VDYFIDKFNKKLGLNISGIDDEPKEIFLRYEWPGNIRELENLIERMMLLAKSDKLTLNEVPAEFIASLESSAATVAPDDKKPFKDAMRSHMENVERQMIIKCLEESGDNVTKAAKLLGLSRKGLQLKMIRYNLRK
jgi:transcriptional regulator with PAS, ATPase and Fis domain